MQGLEAPFADIQVYGIRTSLPVVVYGIAEAESENGSAQILAGGHGIICIFKSLDVGHGTEYIFHGQGKDEFSF